MEVIFEPEVFKDMVLFSGRFANNTIPESDWKEVYGFLVGKITENEGKKVLLVKNLIPMIHGTRTEVYFGEQDYAISEQIMDEIFKAELFVCGWFHTHPGLDLFLSETDIYNHLGFQSVFEDAIAVVFDFTKISETNNGFKIYRLNDVNLGVASEYSEIPYQIERETESKSDKFFMARSLIGISDVYDKNKPLIQEAAEILKEKGSLNGILNRYGQNSTESGISSLQVGDQSQIEQNQIEQNQSDILSGIPTDSAESGDYRQDIKNLEMDKTFSLHPENIPHIVRRPRKQIQGQGSKIESSADNPPILDKKIAENQSSYSESGYYDLLENYSENDWEIRALRERIVKAQEELESTGYLSIKLAQKLVEISKIEEALGYLESAESEFYANNDKEGLAIVKNELGLYYEERGDYDSALNYFEATINLLQELNDKIKEVQVTNNIGNVYLNLNQHDVAFSYYKKAYEKSGSINYALGIIASLNNAVDILLFLNNHMLAYKVLVHNYRFFEKTRNVFGMGLTLTKFGHLYYMQGQRYFNLSIRYFKAALKIKNQNEFFRETLEDWNFLSKIFMKMSDYDLCEFCIMQGLNTTRTFNLTKEEGEIYSLYGDLYYQQNKIKEAIEYYEFALENYQDFGLDDKITELYEKLGNLFLKKENSNSPENLDKALQSYYGALEIYRNQHYSKMIADTLAKVSNIHLRLGDQKSAEECLLEAKNIYYSLYDEYSANLMDEKLNSLKIN